MFRQVWAVYIGHAISEDPVVFLGANTKVTKFLFKWHVRMVRVVRVSEQ